MKSENSCYNCQDRCVGCHANCEKYKQFKMEREELNKRKRNYYAERTRGYYHG